MKNVTITLYEEVARWVRVRAAEADRSVSRWVGELLEERMRFDGEYETAKRRYLARAGRKLRREGEALPSRDELHDRPRLR